MSEGGGGGEGQPSFSLQKGKGKEGGKITEKERERERGEEAHPIPFLPSFPIQWGKGDYEFFRLCISE